MFSFLLLAILLASSVVHRSTGSWMDPGFDVTTRAKGVKKIVNSSDELPPRPAMVFDSDGNGILDLKEQDILSAMLDCMRNESNGTIPTEDIQLELQAANRTEEGFIIVEDIVDQYGAWKTQLYHMNMSDYVDNIVEVCHNRTPGSPDSIRGFCRWICRWDLRCQCTFGGRYSWIWRCWKCWYVLFCGICSWFGCFPNSAQIQTPFGPKMMTDLRIGDSVLTASSSGNLHYTDVIGFTQFSTDMGSAFLQLQAASGQSVITSPNHLIFSKQYPEGTSAENIRVGDQIWVKSFANSSLFLSRVLSVSNATEQGLISPLTAEGTILVDNVLMSCYAFEDSLVGHKTGHAIYAPMRWLNTANKYLGIPPVVPTDDSSFDDYGAHWYRLFLKRAYTNAKSVIF